MNSQIAKIARVLSIVNGGKPKDNKRKMRRWKNANRWGMRKGFIQATQ